MIDIVESSMSQEEVDEGNSRLLESPPAAEAQPTQPSSASEGEGVASPSAAVQEGRLISLPCRYRQLVYHHV